MDPKMDSNPKITINLILPKKKNKRRIQLCEDVDHLDLQMMTLNQKTEFHKIIKEKIKRIRNQSIDPKEDLMKWFNNNLFLSKTKLIIDKSHLELKQILFIISDAMPNSDHYFALTRKRTQIKNKLKFQSKVLKKEINLYKNCIQTIDENFDKTLTEEKANNWCRVCFRSAVEPFVCCRNGYYCSYTHYKGDRTHFIYCTRNRDSDKNAFL